MTLMRILCFRWMTFFLKKITGRKENVEDAKKRILTQVERLVSFYIIYMLSLTELLFPIGR